MNRVYQPNPAPMWAPARPENRQQELARMAIGDARRQSLAAKTVPLGRIPGRFRVVIGCSIFIAIMSLWFLASWQHSRTEPAKEARVNQLNALEHRIKHLDASIAQTIQIDSILGGRAEMVDRFGSDAKWADGKILAPEGLNEAYEASSHARVETDRINRTREKYRDQERKLRVDLASMMAEAASVRAAIKEEER